MNHLKRLSHACERIERVQISPVCEHGTHTLERVAQVAWLCVARSKDMHTYYYRAYTHTFSRTMMNRRSELTHMSSRIYMRWCRRSARVVVHSA